MDCTIDVLIEILEKRRDTMGNIKQTCIQVEGYKQGVNDCIKDLQEYKKLLNEVKDMMDKKTY